MAAGGRSDGIARELRTGLVTVAVRMSRKGRDRKMETFGVCALAAWRGVIWCAAMFVDRGLTLVVLE